MLKRLLFAVSFFGLSASLSVAKEEEARLMRFPTISENAVVFTYAGDLYRVNREGGIARRLTSHKGYEIFPKFSPNGRKIAFAAQYNG